MALIAEELVQEWLHRSGHFAIRGARTGVHEIDLLALRVTSEGQFVARHIEVACSVRPIGYLGPVRSARSQTEQEQRANAAAWYEKKFHAPGKEALRDLLVPGASWSFEVVTHVMKGPFQLSELRDRGVKVHRFSEVVRELTAGKSVIRGTGGSDLFDLLHLKDSTPIPEGDLP